MSCGGDRYPGFARAMTDLAQWRREHGDPRTVPGEARTQFRLLVANARWEGACWIDLGELLRLDPEELQQMVGSIPRYGETLAESSARCVHIKHERHRRKKHSHAATAPSQSGS